MTSAQLISKLEVVADLGDQDVKILAEILIDYFGSDNTEQIGFNREAK